eukprot:1161646-Pelagomonas_calceolata.AAC.20
MQCCASCFSSHGMRFIQRHEMSPPGPRCARVPLSSHLVRDHVRAGGCFERAALPLSCTLHPCERACVLMKRVRSCKMCQGILLPIMRKLQAVIKSDCPAIIRNRADPHDLQKKGNVQTKCQCLIFSHFKLGSTD